MDNVDVYNLSIGLMLLNFFLVVIFVDVYEEIMLEFWNEDQEKKKEKCKKKGFINLIMINVFLKIVDFMKKIWVLNKIKKEFKK